MEPQTNNAHLCAQLGKQASLFYRGAPRIARDGPRLQEALDFSHLFLHGHQRVMVLPETFKHSSDFNPGNDAADDQRGHQQDRQITLRKILDGHK